MISHDSKIGKAVTTFLRQFSRQLKSSQTQDMAKLRREFIKENKKTRKKERKQELDQEKKKVFSFFLDHFLGRVLVFCFLTCLFS